MSKKLGLVLPAALLAMGTAHAQTPDAAPAAAPAAVAAPAMRKITLAPNSEVVVTPIDTLSSKTLKLGDKFRLVSVFDVMQDGFVVIPRGTPGEGTVSWRTGKGAFGKSGKFEIEFNSLDLNGRKVMLTGKHRQEGDGNTGAAVGAVVAVGVFGAFVTGHSANIVNGQQLRAHTAEALSFDVPAGAVAVPTASLSAPAAPAVPAAPAASAAPAAAK